MTTAKQYLEMGWNAALSIFLTVVYYSLRAIWKTLYFFIYWISVLFVILIGCFIAAIAFVASLFVDTIINFFERCLKSS
ncbi:hypothetical protein [Runella zeae]|uniref:hypothetical protein n=1 Tax=Runella zeae TaxID=94255 RepID=UPI0023543857|nr:hypothetical protein [Runella zeae]